MIAIMKIIGQQAEEFIQNILKQVRNGVLKEH